MENAKGKLRSANTFLGRIDAITSPLHQWFKPGTLIAMAFVFGCGLANHFSVGQDSAAAAVGEAATDAKPQNAESPFVLQEGFEVVAVAGDKLVHDCFAMTIDSQGHPVVSGPGYIKTLLDDNSDGIYDRSVLWMDGPKQGAQGLWVENRQLYYVGDGGLWLSEDSNGDFVGDRGARKILNLPTGGEHDAHAIRRGPDGFWYLIVGNFANGISKLLNDPASPVSRPRSGTLWRISPDFSSRSVWSHGMRNCYDFDFLPDGQVVTFDSDDEREAVLPWYRPTRVMVMGPGSDAGWCGQTWKDRDDQILMPQVIGSMGRSSPTGVAVYEHSAYPDRYRGAVFVLDWTFGRVLCIYPNDNLPEDQRAPGRLPAEIFMQTTGTVGFAPTDLCVAPDGSLLICVGGRGTAGALYRVRYTGSDRTEDIPAKSLAKRLEQGGVATETAARVASAIQAPSPWESWSEALWSSSMKRSEVDCLLRIVTGELPVDSSDCIGLTTNVTLRAAQLLTRLGGNIPTLALENGFANQKHDASGLWWLTGRGKTLSDDRELNKIASWLKASSPLANQAPFTSSVPWEVHLGPNAERLKWEAIGLRKVAINRVESWNPSQESEWGRGLRRTWLWALSRSSANSPSKAGDIDLLFARKLHSQSGALDTPLLDALAATVPTKAATWGGQEQMEFLAMLQWALGERRTGLTGQQDPPNSDVLDGYRAISLNQLPQKVRAAWVQWVVYIGSKAHAAGNEKLESEAIRTLAMLEPTDSKTLEWLLSLPGDKSHPTADINLLCCVARCAAPRSNTDSERSAAILAGTVRKVRDYGLNIDNQWPKRIQQLIAALVARDARLGLAYVRVVESYVPEDLSVLVGFPVDVQVAARGQMKRMLLNSEPETWAPALLKHCLSDGAAGADWEKPIREAAKHSKLRALAMEQISRSPRSSDYELFLSALESEDRNAWEPAWKGLQRIPRSEPSKEWPILARVAFVSGQSNTGISFPEVAERCKKVAMECGVQDLPSVLAWEAWQPFLARYSSSAGKASVNSSPAIAWRDKVEAANSLEGDAERGLAIYETRCLNCHGGQSALGPSLAGVSKRFSTEDLFVAIFEPSRDISDRYRALKILTVDGDVLTGMSIYKATDGTTLMTPKGETVRINQQDIEEQAFSKESLMPSGLLDFAAPQDIADLLRYLQTL